MKRPHQPEEPRIAGNQADGTGAETEPAFPAVYHLINTPLFIFKTLQIISEQDDF
jgi:hypothetical protein